MDLNFKSTNVKDLKNIAIDFHEYIKTNQDASSKDIYLHNLVSNIIQKHRKLPTNIGYEYKSTNIKGKCEICSKHMNKNTVIKRLPCTH